MRNWKLSLFISLTMLWTTCAVYASTPHPEVKVTFNFTQPVVVKETTYFLFIHDDDTKNPHCIANKGSGSITCSTNHAGVIHASFAIWGTGKGGEKPWLSLATVHVDKPQVGGVNFTVYPTLDVHVTLSQYKWSGRHPIITGKITPSNEPGPEPTS